MCRRRNKRGGKLQKYLVETRHNWENVVLLCYEAKFSTNHRTPRAGRCNFLERTCDLVRGKAPKGGEKRARRPATRRKTYADYAQSHLLKREIGVFFFVSLAAVQVVVALEFTWVC
jgi:hypothetical protein